MLFETPPSPRSPSHDAIDRAWLTDEEACVRERLDQARLDPQSLAQIRELARRLLHKVRGKHRASGAVESFIREYDLSSHEGVLLMRLAEALLRIPDSATADRLIADKLARGEWDNHLGHSHSLLVNASTWGLMLTGRLVAPPAELTEHPEGILARLATRLGEPVIRTAVRQAMRVLGHRFVMGSTIRDALDRARQHSGYRYSYDMLGEAALTCADAARYLDSYAKAIEAVGKAADGTASIFDRPSISVKLSALHPRYEFAQRARVMRELTPQLLTLAQQARTAGIGLTVDAEEADRLDLSLDIFEQVYLDASLKGWEGFGLAVQAYQKRAVAVIDALVELARKGRRRIPLRLVKGAYWDGEIKRAQERGLPGYPVFTRKAATDVSYLACARRMLAAPDAIYPQFATHNARTVATILQLTHGTDFEFQRLHGMGEELYDVVLADEKLARHCRIYAPVGNHRDLLPYLVRRLLENGANSSFINRLHDDSVPIDEIIADPVAALATLEHKANPRIPLPANIYGDERRNSAGLNLAERDVLATLDTELETALTHDWHAGPIVGGHEVGNGEIRSVSGPFDSRHIIGTVADADAGIAQEALRRAHAATFDWNATPATDRATLLRRAADLLEQHRSELMALIIREGGRTVNDALNEVREAVDFCRYYAVLAQRHFSNDLPLPGVTGENNRLRLAGRGVFVCISPWNFPVAIFTGQITAALAAGNTVIAKPAGPTPLCAMRVVQLLHQAGIPVDALHLLPGSGALLGETLLADPRVAGVAFTGSTDTTRQIHTLLARRPTIVPLIAETGGQNAMIVDSSALPEQVVIDAVTSAFNSAGQRCSALRVLFAQDDIADRVIELLHGAMGELRLGDPGRLDTDIGPVINATARTTLEAHAARMATEARLIRRLEIPAGLEHGSFFPPTAYEIERLEQLPGEVFGPLLHVLRYPARALDQVIDAINATGYGLTLGIHSRIESTVEHISRRVHCGNIYVNRNVIGAVVGAQPFGGEGLSGTGPKAGGPHYLFRYATERVISTNTAAVGGNTTLLTLDGGE